ncbi:MAG: molybdopterin biosynthesis protein [Proteobacteria bacterium]|nr:molybdopterin biosynthesis protein [Pseudomonadota bacterium]
MSPKRNIYLKMKSLEEARQILFDRFSNKKICDTEMLPVPDAVGRILSEPVSAKISSPHFHAAAMDGIAVNAAQTFGAGENRPKDLLIGKDAFYVNTGHMIPENCNAVIMIEHIQVISGDTIRIEAPAFPWQHIRKMGEDIVATELLFPSNHKITSYCLGALLSGGIFAVPVYKKPRVLVIPTGSELVDGFLDLHPDKHLLDLKPGKVIESNSYVLGGLIRSAGGEYERIKIVGDDLDTIKKSVDGFTKKDVDMILIIGGSSAGSEDFASHVIGELGEILVHGVTIMPGKPVILGDINHIPVIGIPGYPVSAIISFEQFAEPLLLNMTGQPEQERPEIDVTPTRKIPSKLGVEEFLRIKIGHVGDKTVCTPLPRGAGFITSITQADGIIRIPNHVEGLTAETPVRATLLKTASSIRKTLVVAGSHDNTLDILSDQLGRDAGISLSSSHVGSMGGLIALKKGVCHLAGSHLLDADDGSYNVTYIKKYLKDVHVNVVHLVMRDQGLIIPKHNPKQIKGIEDLSRGDIRFMNRQAGSGTRILLDFKLSQLGIDPETIIGYADEEYTHMSVAVSVLSGRVDVGLGIYAAAKALNLDFIPVVTEQYDLVIPGEFFNSPNMQKLIETINTKRFKARVNALGGYHTHMTGNIIL